MIPRSKILAALEKFQMQKSEEDLLARLIHALEGMGKIGSLVGPRGERGFIGPKGDSIIGPKGDKGEKGESGEDGYTPRKGIDYFDGEKGDKGDSGKDGEDADISEIYSIVTDEVEDHEKKHDHTLIHDPKMLAKWPVDETSVQTGDFLQFNGTKWIGGKIAFPKAEKPKYFGSNAPSNPTSTVLTITSNYTLEPSDGTIHIDATSGNITLTLYSATVANEGGRSRIHHFKRVDATSNTVTFALQGSETIEFSTTFQLPNQGNSITIYSNQSNWFIR